MQRERLFTGVEKVVDSVVGPRVSRMHMCVGVGDDGWQRKQKEREGGGETADFLPFIFLLCQINRAKKFLTHAGK